jgi:DNA-binding transcriptional regulator/RsmH inhibitor MraZ
MAKNAEQDNQGRILVPAEMKEEAGIEKTVLSVGNRNRIEIWNPDKANNYVLEKSMGKPDAFAVANSFGIRL